jgi:hypothetical protein
MGEGVALRGLRPLWRLRRPRHIGSSCDVLELPAPSHARVCSLAAVLRPSAAAATGSAAFGRAGAFGARWHLHWHAIVSSRAVQARASARSQALDATCVSRKNYVAMGTPHFAPSAKFQLILQVFPTEVCKGFASKCPGGQIDRLRTDTLISLNEREREQFIAGLSRGPGIHTTGRFPGSSARGPGNGEGTGGESKEEEKKGQPSPFPGKIPGAIVHFSTFCTARPPKGIAARAAPH